MRHFALFFALSILACGGTTGAKPDDGKVTVGAGTNCGQQNGSTDCRSTVTCQAGNYCTNNFYVKDYCQPGCTSDANCGQGDACARCPGEAVGVCQRCGSALSCGMGSKCKASNIISSFCTSDGQGPDGYECTDSDKPVGQCAQSKTSPTAYCCGTPAAPTCTANPSSNQCDNVWPQFMGKPGDYSKPYTCNGTATPAGTCKHLLGDTWCCN